MLWHVLAGDWLLKGAVNARRSPPSRAVQHATLECGVHAHTTRGGAMASDPASPILHESDPV